MVSCYVPFRHSNVISGPDLHYAGQLLRTILVITYYFRSRFVLPWAFGTLGIFATFFCQI